MQQRPVPPRGTGTARRERRSGAVDGARGREPGTGADPEQLAARPGRFAVGVVGAGRVGPVLGAALARAGHVVVAASGISDRSRERAERMLPGVPLLPAVEVAAAAEL